MPGRALFLVEFPDPLDQVEVGIVGRQRNDPDPAVVLAIIPPGFWKFPEGFVSLGENGEMQ
jgi:hypothetical protein